MAPDPALQTGNNEKVEDTKDRFGYQWNLLNDKFSGRYRDDFVKEFNELSPFIKKEEFAGKMYLDAGCGTGEVLNIAAHEGVRLAVGVDISSSVCAAGKNNRNNGNVSILQADLNKLPFNADFDIITAFGVLHHTPEPRRGFFELARHLKPGGKIEILIYAKENSQLIMRIVNLLRRSIYKANNRVRYAAALMINAVSSIFVWSYYWGVKLLGRFFRGRYNEYALYLYTKGFAYRQAIFLDFLSTPIIYFFTKDDIEQWYSESGLVNFRIKKRNNNTWCAYGEKP